MRNNRFLSTLLLVLCFIAFVHASYGPGITPPPELIPRQNNNKDNTETGNNSDNQSKTDSSNDATTTAEEDPKTTPKPTGKDSEGDNSSRSGDGTITGTPTRTRTTQIPFNVPPGGIEMKTPSIFDSMQYYPIGAADPITFVWNMTSVRASPTALNIEAYCNLNQNYYTIASNYSAQATKVTWDTKEVVSSGINLPMETYTLYIYDSSQARTAIPQPGKLGTFSNLRFALYSPQSAIPLKDYKCDLCSDASKIFTYHEVRVFLGSAFLFAISMAWFIAGVAW